MKILVVHEVSYLKKVVYEYQDFAERLAARGHEVSVIDYDAEGDCEYRKVEVSKTGIGKVTLENTPYLNLPLIKYISGRLNYSKLLEAKLKRREVDVVFLYSIAINGTNTISLCRKYGVPVVYRVLDVYHRIRESALTALPLYLGEQYTYRNADVVCLTNEKMEGYVQKMAGPGRLAPVSVIHHGVDTEFFKPMSRDREFAAKCGIAPEDRVALFLGTTYTFSGLDRIVENFEMLRTLCPGVKVIVVGGGDLDRKLAESVKAKGLEKDVILTGFRPYEEVPRWISLADVTFNSFYINDITRDIIPIKMLQYMACGKPVVCAPIPDVMRLFPDRESGMVYCGINNVDQYLGMLARLLRDSAEREFLSKKATSYVRNGFAVNSQADKLEALLRKCVERTAINRVNN